MNYEVNDYSIVISAGTLHLCEQLTSLERAEGNSERAFRKDAVVKRKRQAMREAFPVETEGLDDMELAVRLLPVNWPRDKCVSLLIDLAFSAPFAPYELKVKEKHFDTALRTIAGMLGDSVQPEVVSDIQKTRKEAMRVHRHVAWGNVAKWGIGGLVAMGFSGWFIAPAIAALLGSGAGLVGAAATSHGLALLGGGSLAMGGLGMAGGMWVVTATGTIMGGIAFGGGALLLEIGASQARIELVKLQVNYRLTLIGNQVQLKKAQEVLVNLAKERDYVKSRLDEERLLNDSNSRRIKEMEDTLLAMEEALGWMKETN